MVQQIRSKWIRFILTNGMCKVKMGEREEKMENRGNAKSVALYGLLIALAMVLSFVESLIPIPIPVPGVKLGLANLVTVAGLYLVGIPGTICVTLLRIVLVGFSFGNPYSMLYVFPEVLSACWSCLQPGNTVCFPWSESVCWEAFFTISVR